MKNFKMISKKVILVLCIAIFFVMSCGFTFVPESSYPEASIDFNSGASVAMTKEGGEAYGTEVTIAGKKGLTQRNELDRNLYLLVDPDAYKDIHKVKVVIEWFDIADTTNSIYANFKLTYSKTSTYGQIQQKLTSVSGGWRVAEYEINDIDFTATNIIKTGTPCNLALLGDKLQRTYNDVSWWGTLFTSVKVIPLEGSYKLEAADDTDDAVFKAGETDTTENLTVVRNATAGRMITDANGVSKYGKTYAATNNKDACFRLDPEKYAGVSKVNVEITFYEAPETGTSTGTLKITWPTKNVYLWNKTVNQTEQLYSTNKSGWVTKTVTLTDCDFTKLNVVDGTKSLTNFGVYTSNGNKDNGTADDTSDDFLGVMISEIKVTPIPEYAFSSLKFTDIEGTELSAIPANAEFYTDLTVTRTGGVDSADVTLIVALVDDESGSIEKVAYNTISMEPDTIQPFKTCFTTPADVSGTHLEIFVWDSMTSLKPLSNRLIAQ